MANSSPFITPIGDQTQFGPFASPLVDPTKLFWWGSSQLTQTPPKQTSPAKTKPVDQEKNVTMAKLASANTPLIQTTNPMKFWLQNIGYWPLAQNDMFSQNIMAAIEGMKKWTPPKITPMSNPTSTSYQTQSTPQPEQKSWMQSNIVDPYFSWKDKKIEENPTYKQADEQVKATVVDMAAKLRMKYPEYADIESDDNVIWLYSQQYPDKWAKAKEKYFDTQVQQMNEVSKLDPFRLVTQNFFDQNAQDLEAKKEAGDRSLMDSVKGSLNSTASMIVWWSTKLVSWAWNTMTRGIINTFWWDTARFDKDIVGTNQAQDTADVLEWVGNIALGITAMPVTLAFNAAAATPYLDNIPKAMTWVFWKATQGTRAIGKWMFGEDNMVEQYYDQLDPKRQEMMDNLLGALIVHRVATTKVKNQNGKFSPTTALKDLASPQKMLSSIKDAALNIGKPWEWTQPWTIGELVYNLGADGMKWLYSAVKGSYEMKWVQWLPEWDTPVKTSMFGKKETWSDVAGKIFQSGDEAKNIKAAQGLKEINTKWVETYKDLESIVSKRASDIAKEQDTFLGKSTKEFTADEISTKTNVWGKDVSQNYFDNALTDLRDLYSKQANNAEVARIDQVIEKMNTKGLTLNEKNAIAREYGVKESAYSDKSWAPLTSSTAEGRENIRVAMKEVIRANAEKAWLDQWASKSIDSRYSNIMETQRLAWDMKKKVQTLQNKLKSRGIGYKITQWLLKVGDLLSLWSLRWLRDYFVTSNEWNKINNSMDIQNELKSNLAKMDKLLKSIDWAKTKAQAQKIIDDFEDDLKGNKQTQKPAQQSNTAPQKQVKQSPFQWVKKKTQTVDNNTKAGTKTQKVSNKVPETGAKRYEQGRLFERDYEYNWSRVSQDDAKAIVKKYFKDSEVSVVFRDKITTPEWQNAIGAYHNAMIEFAKNPKDTTAEHEVVHAYIDLFKTNEQKRAIVDYALKSNEKAIHKIMEKFGIKDKYEAAEEFVADWFIDYVKGKKTVKGKLLMFFKNLWNEVKRVFGKDDKIRSLYNDISSGSRPVKNPFSNMSSKRSFQDWERFADSEAKNNVSVRFLDDINNQIKKDEISKTFIDNYANRPELKGPEKRILKQIVESMDGDKISKQDFVQKVKWELLDLKYKESNTYADYNYLRNSDWDNGDNMRYDIDSAKTHIYEAPFSTKWLGHHFRSESNNYFAHARVEDIWDVHRVTEIQSDLFQKKRYQEHDYERRIESMKEEIKGKIEKWNEHIKFLDTATSVLKWMDVRMNADWPMATIIAEKIAAKYEWMNAKEIESKLDGVMHFSKVDSKTIQWLIDWIKENKEDSKTNMDNLVKSLDEWNSKTTDDLERQSFDVQRLKANIEAEKEVIKQAQNMDPKDVVKMVQEHKKIDDEIVKLNDSKPKWADTWNMDEKTKAQYDSTQEKIRELDRKQWDIVKKLANVWVKVYDDMSVENIRSLMNKKIEYNQRQLQIDESFYAKAVEESEIAIANSKNKWRWLNDYANTFHERILREKIKVAAQNGQEYVQIPMPKTIAMIEGYISNGEWISRDANMWDVVDSRWDEYILVKTDAYESEAAWIPTRNIEHRVDYEQWIKNEADYKLDSMVDDPYIIQSVIDEMEKSDKRDFFEMIKKKMDDWELEIEDEHMLELLNDEEKFDYDNYKKYDIEDEIENNEALRELFKDEFWEKYSEHAVWVMLSDYTEKYRSPSTIADWIVEYIKNEQSDWSWSYTSDWELIKFDWDVEDIYEPLPYSSWKSSEDPNRKDNIDDNQRAVVDFYDKKIIPYAKKLRKDAEVVEQDGWEWLQIPVKPEDAEKPVMAYQRDILQSITDIVWDYRTINKYDPVKKTWWNLKMIADEVSKIDWAKEFMKENWINGIEDFSKFIQAINMKIRPWINKAKKSELENIKKDIFTKKMEWLLQSAWVIKPWETPLQDLKKQSPFAWLRQTKNIQK